MPYRHSSGVYDPKFKANRRRRELEDMLGEWYSRKFAAFEVAGHAESARSIGSLVEALVNKRLDDATRTALHIRERWSDLIGPPLNKYALFYTINDGIVIVEVTHPAFLQELRRPGVTAEWCAKLNREFPAAQITGIRFVPVGQSPETTRGS